MASFDLSVGIDRPAEEVFMFLTDVENRPRWISAVEEMELTSEGPLGVGSTARMVQRVLGRRMKTDILYTEYEPNRKISAKSTAGPMSFQLSYTLETVEGGTRLNMAVQGSAPGLFKLAEPVVVRILKRSFEADLANLKDLLEAQIQG